MAIFSDLNSNCSENFLHLPQTLYKNIWGVQHMLTKTAKPGFEIAACDGLHSLRREGNEASAFGGYGLQF